MAAGLLWNSRMFMRSGLVLRRRWRPGSDLKEKKSTMDTYWVPGVNHDGRYGRWAFVEFTDVYEIGSGFAQKVEARFRSEGEEIDHGYLLGAGGESRRQVWPLGFCGIHGCL